jgi:ABC-type transport system substrate-binding protein
MQRLLNRSVLLEAVYGGRGNVENGIYPAGLYGYDPDLPDIPYDPEGAKELLAEAGYPNGFDLTVSVNSASTRWELSVLRIAASMWEKAGIHAEIDVIDESEFMSLRKSGRLECYTAQWMADYNDPDNFIYTFFGNWENTSFRSLCYPDKDVMKRVRLARAIADPDERIKEYRELQSKIVQDDAAWIPLYSRLRYYVSSERLEGVQASWNGSVKNNYRELSIADGE